MTISASGNWARLPVWSQCACVMTTLVTASGAMPSSGSAAAAGLASEAGVHQRHGAVLADASAVADDPEVVIDVERLVQFAVDVIVEEALRLPRHPAAVVDGEHLARHGLSHP
jgi:hypothetical protein